MTVFELDGDPWAETTPDLATHTTELPTFDLVPRALGVGEDAQYLRRALRHEPPLVPVPSDAPTWLTEVYLFVSRQQTDEAIDVLFERVDVLLSEEQFEQCNDILQAIDLKRLDTNLIVGVLSITLAATEVLPYRKRFFDRCRARLIELAPNRVDGLLSGLRGVE